MSVTLDGQDLWFRTRSDIRASEVIYRTSTNGYDYIITSGAIENGVVEIPQTNHAMLMPLAVFPPLSLCH